MLSELAFGSFLSYDPRGDGVLDRSSRDITYALKQDAAHGTTGLTTSQYVARRMKELVPGSALEEFLDADAVLVPMPRSGVLREGDLWPARRIASAMRSEGFGSRVSSMITRTRGVQRSATAAGSRRLWPDQHYDSLGVQPTVGAKPKLIVLVDDVITRGSMLLGAAARLHDVFPDAELRAFAVVRTVKETELLRRLVDPRVGMISWRPGWITRDP